MNNSFLKGINAELKSIKILENKGFEIIGHRIKSKFGEIDILAKHNDIFYITEVKFRKNIIDASYSIRKNQLIRSLNTFYDYSQKKMINYEQIYFIVMLITPTNHKIINIDNWESIIDF